MTTKTAIRVITHPAATMLAVAICFAFSIPLMAWSNAHAIPIHWSISARLVNGLLLIAAAPVVGYRTTIRWQHIVRNPQGLWLTPIFGAQALALPIVAFATSFVTPTVVACILATYRLATCLWHPIGCTGCKPAPQSDLA